MWDLESLSVAQSLLISGAGMLVVVTELALLALAIKLFTGILAGFGGKSPDQAKGGTESGSSPDDDSYAMILAVMSEELHSSGLKYKVTSVRETGN